MESSEDMPPSPPPLPRYPTVLRESMNETLSATNEDDELLPAEENSSVPRFPSFTDVGLGSGSNNMGVGARLDSLKEVDSLKEIQGFKEVESLKEIQNLASSSLADGGGVKENVEVETSLDNAAMEKADSSGNKSGVREMGGVMQSLQMMVCKMPDPVLLFYVELFLLFVLDILMPSVLKTWCARIIVPLLFTCTIAAATLWRKTRVIPLRRSNSVDSSGVEASNRFMYLPSLQMPNVKKIVTKGEKLRKREAALAEREDALRKSQIRLEAMRKEIEGRLPPTESVEGALQSAIKSNSKSQA